MIRRVVALLALATCPCRGSVAAATSLTLDDALARARTGHPTVRVAAAELDAARARLDQAGMIPANPVVSVELARHTEPGNVGIDRGVALSQEVEVGGQGALRVAAARHDVTRAELTLADRLRVVDAEVRRAFAGVEAADRRYVLATESAGLSTRLADAATRRARAGDVGALDVELAHVETVRATQAVAAAEFDRARAKARLATAIAADPGDVLGVAGVRDRVPPPPSESVLVDRALRARPDLAAAQAQMARFGAEADLTARRGRITNPVLRGFYRQERLNERIVGGEIAIPLPVWNREQGATMALRAEAAAAGAEIERLRREIPREVHLALVRWHAAAEAETRYERDALPAVRSARDLIERSYDGGYLGLPEVLAQRGRLLDVQGAAIAAWLDLREAEADLREAVGEAAS